MNVEAFKVSLKIQITENVTRTIEMMAQKFKTVNLEAKELEKRLESIEKMSSRGGNLMKLGTDGPKLLEEPLRKAQEYASYVAKLRQQGVGNGTDGARVGQIAGNVSKAVQVSGHMRGSEKQTAGAAADQKTSELIAHVAKLADHVKRSEAVAHATRKGNDVALSDDSVANAHGRKQTEKAKMADALNAHRKAKDVSTMVGGSANPSLSGYQTLLKMLDTSGEKLEQSKKVLEGTTQALSGMSRALSKVSEFSNKYPEVQKKIVDFQTVLGKIKNGVGETTRVVSGLSQALSTASAFAKKYPKLVQFFADGKTFVATLTMIGDASSKAATMLKQLKALDEVKNIGSMLKNVLSGVGLALRVFGQGILWLGRTFLLNPIGLVIGGIAAAVFLLWKNWDSIRPKLLAAWEWMKNSFVGFITYFLTGLQNFYNTVISGINKILPKSMEIKKFSFADDLANGHAGTALTNNTIRPAPSATANAQSGNVYLDGHKVGNVLARRMGNTVNKGLGTGLFDANMSMPTSALNR